MNVLDDSDTSLGVTDNAFDVCGNKKYDMETMKEQKDDTEKGEIEDREQMCFSCFKFVYSSVKYH